MPVARGRPIIPGTGSAARAQLVRVLRVARPGPRWRICKPRPGPMAPDLAGALWVGLPGSKCSVGRRARSGPTGHLTSLSSPGTTRWQCSCEAVHAKLLPRQVVATLRQAVAKERFAGHSARDAWLGSAIGLAIGLTSLGSPRPSSGPCSCQRRGSRGGLWEVTLERLG